MKKKNITSESSNIALKISYKDTNGQTHENEQQVEFKELSSDYYDNTGIQKAIVLARYVNTLKNWIIYERTNNQEFDIDVYSGIKEFDYDEEDVKRILNANEKTSTKLTVSDSYKETFKTLKSYLESENKILKDDTLKNEIEILDKLI